MICFYNKWNDLDFDIVNNPFLDVEFFALHLMMHTIMFDSLSF